MSAIPRHRLNVIAGLVEGVAHLPGDMAEFGVYRGGSARVIADAAPGKVIHLFDTFSGIPHDDVHACGHRRGDFGDTSLEVVQRVLDGCNVRYHVGLFQDTAKGLSDLRFSFVHIDSDLEASIAAGIAYFEPRMVPGGVIVWDDYDGDRCPGVRKLVDCAFAGRVEVGDQQAWVRFP